MLDKATGGAVWAKPYAEAARSKVRLLLQKVCAVCLRSVAASGTWGWIALWVMAVTAMSTVLTPSTLKPKYCSLFQHPYCGCSPDSAVLCRAALVLQLHRSSLLTSWC